MILTQLLMRKAMRMSKKYICLLLILLTMSLCGCEKSETLGSSISSNDGFPEVISPNTNPTDTVAGKNTSISEPKTDMDTDITDINTSALAEAVENITEEQALALLDMNLKEALDFFGLGYSKIRTGVEDSEVGYWYPCGVLIVVDSDEENISRIELSGSTRYEDVLPGMKFDEIIQILGDTKIQEIDYETHTVYRLVYELGERKCTIRSNSQDGSESIIVFH